MMTTRITHRMLKIANVFPDFVIKCSANIERKEQRNDGGVKHFVDDTGKILYGLIKSIANSLPRITERQETQNKSQNYGRQRVQNR